MKKQKKQVIIMAIFLVFLIVLYFALGAYNDEQAKNEEESTENETIVVTDYDCKNVVSFSYDYKEENNSFSKSENIWNYNGDVTFDVDESLVEEMLSEACSVVAQDYFDAYESLDNYGLDKPQKVVSMTFSDGSVVKLQLGNYNDMVGYYYLMKEGDNNLYLVDSTLLDVFEVSYEELENIVEETEEVKETENGLSE